MPLYRGMALILLMSNDTLVQGISCGRRLRCRSELMQYSLEQPAAVLFTANLSGRKNLEAISYSAHAS